MEGDLPLRKRIGILTGGGDCPGLNAVIRAVTKTAISVYGMEVVGFQDGFRGLVLDQVVPLTYDAVSDILTQGGTILGTSNTDNFFGMKRTVGERLPASENRIADAVRVCRQHGVSGLICVGGDGTLTVAHYLNTHGIPVIGVPKTIDNDVMHTDQTFGFDTACTVATLAIDRLHSTAESHHRVMIIEVMGRHAGWIALHAGVASGGDVILIPEIAYSLPEVCKIVERRSRIGRGTPSPLDRLLATRFGHQAAQLAAKGYYGRMVCLKANAIGSVPLSEVAGRPRTIPMDSPLIQTARDVGTSFGDGR
ncbi:MAG: ATP-dependent 6-phosphofructokinase [Elusimicrobia bacterium]|nr:ATP-dependent 6-phosphofructokinase [Elusimicrobiota bacterium]